MLKPSINKTKYNSNLDQIIADNNALSSLLDILSQHSSYIDSAFLQDLIKQIGNGKTHLLNLNILLKNLKR